MLTQQAAYVSPEIEKIIKEILNDDVRYDQELRSSHREKLILPVSVRFMNGQMTISAFSRNISPGGICLITEQVFEANTMTILQIYRRDNPSSEIIAQCKWCKRFGRQFWMSGWQFLRMSNQ